MDELGFNKIAAAILVTALGFMGLKEISHSAMHVSAPDTPAYALEIEVEAGPGGEPEILPFPQSTWVAAMDETRGAKVFKKCTSCHNADNGGANGTGPNLWNIVGQAAGGKSGFKYSSAMAQSGLVWDYETLEGYLAKPTRYLSGTAMNFVGLKKENDRAAVIAYLRAQSDTPMAMPVAVTTEASAEGVTEMSVDSAENGAAAQVIDTVKDGADAAAGGMKDAGAAVVDAAKDAGGAVVDGAKDAGKMAGDAADKTLDAAGDLLDKAKDKAGDIASDIKKD